MQGKKQELRIESLAALGETIRNLLSILGLMPTSYSEVLKIFHVLESSFLSRYDTLLSYDNAEMT